MPRLTTVRRASAALLPRAKIVQTGSPRPIGVRAGGRSAHQRGQQKAFGTTILRRA